MNDRIEGCVEKRGIKEWREKRGWSKDSMRSEETKDRKESEREKTVV